MVFGTSRTPLIAGNMESFRKSSMEHWVPCTVLGFALYALKQMMMLAGQYYYDMTNGGEIFFTMD